MAFDVWKQAKIQNGFDKVKRVRSNPVPQENKDITLDDLKKLSGVTKQVIGEESNISITGTEKAQLMKKNDIRPGSPEWFKLWFGRPYWFKEPPNR